MKSAKSIRELHEQEQQEAFEVEYWKNHRRWLRTRTWRERLDYWLTMRLADLAYWLCRRL